MLSNEAKRILEIALAEREDRNASAKEIIALINASLSGILPPVAAEWTMKLGTISDDWSSFSFLADGFNWYELTMDIDSLLGNTGIDTGGDNLDLAHLAIISGDTPTADPQLNESTTKTVTVSQFQNGNDLFLKFVHNTPGVASNSDSAFETAIAALIIVLTGNSTPVLVQTIVGAEETTAGSIPLKGAAIADPSGGATIDAESRTAIAAIIDALEAACIIKP